MKNTITIILLCLFSCYSTNSFAQFNTVTEHVSSNRPVQSVCPPPPQSPPPDSTVIQTLLSRYTSVAFPLEEMRITSSFGNRFHPIDKVRKLHNGIDLKANNEPVYAMRDGKVHKCGYDSSSGKYIILHHPDGISVSYCHLSKLCVSKGQSVSAGEMIGVSGNSGKSTAPHLHLVVRKEGKYIDPFNYLQEIINIRQTTIKDYIKLEGQI